MNITPEQLKKMIPNNPDYIEWWNLLTKYMPKYGIDTERRIACFIGQLSHESGEFLKLEENLNYSAKGLRSVFPLYFSSIGEAKLYERNPAKIANRVYASRMGNGSESSNDGWTYRGRGCIMITGKYMYKEFAKSCGKPLQEVLTYLETKEGALHASCWYWEREKLNVYSDKLNIISQTRAINGGLIGYSDRLRKINKNLAIL